MKRVCFHCADHLPLSQFDEVHEDPETGAVCDHCGNIYQRASEQMGHWRPRTAIEVMKESIDDQ